MVEKDLSRLLERNDNVHEDLTRQKEKHARWRERRARQRSKFDKGADTVLTQVDKQCQQQEKQVSRLYSLLESLLDIQKTALHCVENLSASTGPGSQPTVSGRQSHSHKHPTSDTKHGEPGITQGSTDGEKPVEKQTLVDLNSDNSTSGSSSPQNNGNTPEASRPSLVPASVSHAQKPPGNAQPRKDKNKNQQVALPAGHPRSHSVVDQHLEQETQSSSMSSELTSSTSTDHVPSRLDITQDFQRHMAELLNPQTEIPIELWVEWADQEVLKARANYLEKRGQPDYKIGIHTILLIDISDSMKGDNWTFIKHYIIEYLEYAEKESEAIAMVTFGHETRVAHHFTHDYGALRQTLDQVSPGGPTPLYPGLLLCNGIIKGGGNRVELGSAKLKVSTRIVLLTDGRMTGETITGPDVTPLWFDRIQHKARAVTRVEQLCYVFGTQIYVVPVGDYDEVFLNDLAINTDGIFLGLEQQQKQLMRSSLNYRIAGASMAYAPFLVRYNSFRIKEEHPGVTELDLQDINFFLDTEKERIEENKDALSLGGYENMPMIGTRVRRGPDWTPSLEEDGNGPGTIIGLRTDGVLRVCWDETKLKRTYLYGKVGQYAVITVDEPRVLKDGELIQVGCHVQRGSDWQHGDQDGGPGSIGIVFRVLPFRHVTVLWPNGTACNYRFGHREDYEVEVCDPPKEPQMSPVRSVGSRPRLPTGYRNPVQTSQRQGTGLFVPHTKALPAPMSSVPVYTVTSAPSANSPITPASRENTPVTSASGEGTLHMPSTPGFSVSKPSIQPADTAVSSVSTAVRPGSGVSTPVTSVISPTLGATASAAPGTTFSTGATMSVTAASPLGKPPASRPNLAGSHPTPPPILTPSRPIPSLGQDSGPGFQSDQGTVRNSPGNCQWQFKTKAGWKNYSADVCKSLDTCYWQSPKTTAIFYVGGQLYKAIPEKMKVVHLPTKKALDIQRLDV